MFTTRVVLPVCVVVVVAVAVAVAVVVVVGEWSPVDSPS